MTFTNVGYAVFLAVLAVLYYVLPRRAQNALLLCAGVVFYAFNVPRSGFWRAAVPLLLLAASVLFTFYMARAIERAASRRGLLLGTAVGVCVLMLCVFKYANFVLPASNGFCLLYGNLWYVGRPSFVPAFCGTPFYIGVK